MIYMAFVGKEKDRYEAEKTFRKPPEAQEIKKFETYREFFTEVKRENHSLHTAVICLPNCDISEIKAQVLQFEPNARIIPYIST